MRKPMPVLWIETVDTATNRVFDRVGKRDDLVTDEWIGRHIREALSEVAARDGHVVTIRVV